MIKNIIQLLIALSLLGSLNLLAQPVKKMVLLEEFTNTLCPACGNRNPELYDQILSKFEDEVIHIAYHNNRPLPPDPFHQANPEPTLLRTDYYQATSSPTLVVNGERLAADKPLITADELKKYLNQSSDIELSIDESFENDVRKIKVKSILKDALPNGDYKLFVAVAEKHVFFCTYFEYVFDNVFRQFLTNNEGDHFKTVDANYDFEYIPKPDWNEEELYLIAFVQNVNTKAIINAVATTPKKDLPSTRFSNEAFSLLTYIKDDWCAKNEGTIELITCVDTHPFEEATQVSYQWNNGMNGNYIKDLAPGAYTITLNDNLNQKKLTQTYEVKKGKAINVNIATKPDEGNENGSIEVMANGGNGALSIKWNNGGDEFKLNNLAAGNYSFIIEDEKGCTYEQRVILERDFRVGEVSVVVEHVSCFGKKDGQVFITSNGDINVESVVWQLEDNFGTGLNGLAAGNYTFTTFGADNQALHEGSFTVDQPETLAFVTQQSNGFENTLVTIDKVSGGTPPYIYNWSNGATTSQLSGIPFGTYSITVADQNKCESSKTITLIENEFEVTPVSCNGFDDGAITVTINDGLEYAFNWTNGIKMQNLNNLAGGRYGVTINGENSTHFFNFDVQEPAPLLLNLEYDSLNVSIRPQISGGIPPYTFLWNNGAETPTIENPVASNYNLKITDANGCTNEANLEILEITSIADDLHFKQLQVYPNPVETTAFIDLPLSTNLYQIQLLNANGVKQVVSYFKFNDQFQVDFTALPAGIYLLEVMDSRQKIKYLAKLLVCR